MTTVVCLPDEDSAGMLGEVPGVQVVVWDGSGARPQDLARTEFWVPAVEDPGDLAAAFAAMPALKVIQLTSAGIEHVAGRIPAGITLCDARGVHGPAVAELVVLFILAARRQLPHFLDAQQRETWSLVQGDDLQGARVLIVGAGDLGEQTVRRLSGFGVEVTAVARRARDGVHSIDQLPDLLPRADVVVLTLPLTDATRGLVDADFLARMPDGALLVNVARGAIVDTAALLAELRTGRLRAGLDVTDPEPLPDGHPLFSAPNVIITPHAAGHVRSAGPRAFALVRAQLGRYRDGRPLENVVEGDY